MSLLKDIGIGVVGAIGATQTVWAAMQSPSEPELLERIIRDGGLTAVVLVLLYFYRRDWTRLTDQTKPLVDIAQDATQAQVKTAAALEANTLVMREVLAELRVARQERNG